MSQAVIAVNNLNKTVPTAAGDLIILDDVNLEVEKGRRLPSSGPLAQGKPPCSEFWRDWIQLPQAPFD